MQIYEGKIAPPGEGKIAIVVSKFNKTVTQSLLDGCVATLKQNGVRENDITVAWVPGAFELPTIAARFTDDEDYQAVICLGCVIKGETPHDVYIAQSVSQELARLGGETGLPVIFGVLTCNTNDQALARAGLSGAAQKAGDDTPDKILGEEIGNKGVEAANAALEMLDLLIQLPELEDESAPDEDALFYHANRYKAGDFDDAPESDDDFEEEEFDDAPPQRGRFGGGFSGAKPKNPAHKPERSGGFKGSKGAHGGKPYPSKGGFGKGGPKGKPFGGKGKGPKKPR